MAPRKKLKQCSYEEEEKSMKDLSASCEYKSLVKNILGMSISDSNYSRTTSVDVKSMKLEEKNMSRVLSGPRITELNFFPTQDVRMLVVGNDYGNLGFWNIDSGSDSNTKIFVFYPHRTIVSGISIHPYSLSKVISSCNHGIIQLLDVEKESFNVAYISMGEVLSIRRANDNINCLYLGEGDGSVGCLDMRTKGSTSSWELHEEKIFSIDFNSQNTNIMATSSKDGTACIWDLRKLEKYHRFPRQPLRRLRHQGRVDSAYFSPSGALLATTSEDNHIGLMSGRNYEVESMIYHENKTPVSRKLMCSLRGIWGWDDGLIMVGNTKMKGVDVIDTKKKVVSYTLGSPLINAIPCRFDAHPILPGVLAISTSDGQLYVWDI